MSMNRTTFIELGIFILKLIIILEREGFLKAGHKKKL